MTNTCQGWSDCFNSSSTDLQQKIRLCGGEEDEWSLRKLFTIIFCLSYVLSIVVTIFLNALSDYKVVFDLTMATLIANVHLGDKIGWSPLHKAARYDHVEAISALLKGGANVNQLDKDLASPLYYAAIEFQVETIDALIKAGANVNNQEESGPKSLPGC